MLPNTPNNHRVGYAGHVLINGSVHIVITGGDDQLGSQETDILNLETLTWSLGEGLPISIRLGASVPFGKSFLIVGGKPQSNKIFYFEPTKLRWIELEEKLTNANYHITSFMVPNSFANCT